MHLFIHNPPWKYKATQMYKKDSSYWQYKVYAYIRGGLL